MTAHRDAGDPLDAVGPVLAHRAPDRGPAGGALGDVGRVDEPVLDREVQQAVGQREVGARAPAAGARRRPPRSRCSGGRRRGACAPALAAGGEPAHGRRHGVGGVASRRAARCRRGRCRRAGTACRGRCRTPWSPRRPPRTCRSGRCSRSTRCAARPGRTCRPGRPSRWSARRRRRAPRRRGRGAPGRRAAPAAMRSSASSQVAGAEAARRGGRGPAGVVSRSGWSSSSADEQALLAEPAAVGREVRAGHLEHRAGALLARGQRHPALQRAVRAVGRHRGHRPGGGRGHAPTLRGSCFRAVTRALHLGEGRRGARHGGPETPKASRHQLVATAAARRGRGSASRA